MSILPPPQKDGEIKFWFAKGLPYRSRMSLVGLLLAGGLALQLTLGFWPGFAALLAGLLLGINSGYDAKPKKTGKETWEKVTPDEYAKVKLKAARLRSWDEDFFDGTSVSGLVGLAVVALLCLAVYGVLAVKFSFPDGTWVYFGLDAAVLLLPMWFIGTRDYLRKDRLIIKIDMLEKVMAALKDPSDLQVQPMLSLAAAEKGLVPEDARLMVKLVGAPKDLYGLQVQLSVNSVQGKDFPYLYCVLIAKAGSGLLKGWEKFAEQPEVPGLSALLGKLLGKGPAGMEYEPSSSGEVDIIVVRQRTTRTSGYHTNAAAALAVVGRALLLARGLAAGRAEPAGSAG